MKREIKFRGLCARRLVWVYGYLSSKDVINTENGRLKVSSESVGQFTGLKDRNGKEIYEGDLLEVCENKNGSLEVEFINAYVGGWVLSNNSTNEKLSLGARKIQELEVTGNIHQK